jgi:flagellar biosynthesis anti-sigma factor FlgM
MRCRYLNCKAIQGEEVGMRIDLSTSIAEAAEQRQSTRSGVPVASAGSAGEGLADGGTAKLSLNQLSLNHGWVQALAAEVNRIPEIRQDKVAALRQAIHEGNYRVTSEQAAEALLSETQIRSAA